MKLKALVMTLAIAAVSVSVAVAAPSKGRPPQPGANGQAHKPCKGKMLQLSGSYVSGSADSSGAGSFAMQVKRGNRAARRLGLVGTQATLNVDAKTRYRRHGKASLGDLQANDRLSVVARACKPQDSSSDSGGSAPAAPTLVARLVVAHAPKSSGGGGTTTGDTGTTSTSSDDTDSTPTTTEGSGS